MNEIKIIPIPRQMVGEMWMHVAPHLLKGLTAATDVTLKELADALVSGDDQLWAVFDADSVCAAFVTSQFMDEERGIRFVGVYALGGHSLDRWATALGEEMATYARKMGCDCVRFCGREAWSRVLPTYRVVGKRNGEAVFERAVQ